MDIACWLEPGKISWINLAIRETALSLLAELYRSAKTELNERGSTAEHDCVCLQTVMLSSWIL